MVPFTRKRVTLLIIAISLAIAAYVAWPYLLDRLIQNRIVSSIEKLRKEKKIIVTYDTIRVKQGRITLKEIHLTMPAVNDSFPDDASRGSIKSLTISSISLLPILFNQTMKLDSLTLEYPEMSFALNTKKAGVKENKSKLEILGINHLRILSGNISFKDSIDGKTSTKFTFDLQASGLEASNLHLDSTSWHVDAAKMSSVKIELPDQLYKLNIKETRYAYAEKTFNIDSLILIPDYEEAEFMRRSKYQTDRIHFIIPSLKANGVEITAPDKAFLHVAGIELNFWTEIFRDKRYPFRGRVKPLPFKFLSPLPFSLLIDSVLVKSSYISYKEFPEAGASAGKVFFNKLNGTLLNISNNPGEEATMEARASFMDAGMLNAKFTFPSEPDKPYTAQGTITDFDLPQVNSMLTPMANAEITSGRLEELKFNFVYNELRADGELELNYENLKMQSLKKDNKETNKFVTFILRLFVKKDMDRNTATDKKTGTILFYRDKEKSIFNYWWKSILSGIKSVYNLDKITETDGKSDR